VFKHALRGQRMVFRSDHFSVLFCLTPSPCQVTAFSFVAPLWLKGVITALIVAGDACRHALARYSGKCRAPGTNAFPFAGVILEFEGLVTFAL
jgi:hypothetical protein